MSERMDDSKPLKKQKCIIHECRQSDLIAYICRQHEALSILAINWVRQIVINLKVGNMYIKRWGSKTCVTYNEASTGIFNYYRFSLQIMIPNLQGKFSRRIPAPQTPCAHVERDSQMISRGVSQFFTDYSESQYPTKF